MIARIDALAKFASAPNDAIDRVHTAILWTR